MEWIQLCSSAEDGEEDRGRGSVCWCRRKAYQHPQLRGGTIRLRLHPVVCCMDWVHVMSFACLRAIHHRHCLSSFAMSSLLASAWVVMYVYVSLFHLKMHPSKLT